MENDNWSRRPFILTEWHRSCGHMANSARAAELLLAFRLCMQQDRYEFKHWPESKCYYCKCCLLFAYVWSTPCLHFLSHHFLFLKQPLHFYCPKFLSLPEHRLSFLVLDVGSSCSHWLDGCSYTRASHPFIYLPSGPHSGLSSSLSNHVLVSWFMSLHGALSAPHAHIKAPFMTWLPFSGLPPTCHPPWHSQSCEHHGSIFPSLRLLS